MALVVEIIQCLIESTHTQLAGFVHDFLNRLKVAFNNHLSNCRRIEQDFNRRLAPLAVFGAHQPLRNNRAQIRG